jgi:class 3 adenylate cyclase/tetratricopeptide (TPR) repeat protein
VIEWLADSPDRRCQEVESTIAFVDVSGFTKLSERLAKQGKVGAEVLTDAIGNCFAHLLAISYENGGGLIKFGGDALLLLFTGDCHQARACHAAVGMRRALRQVGRLDVSGHRIQLRMSVGVHSGEFNFFLVGRSHRELIVTGPAASQIVAMEGAAEAGEIVVSESTAAALGRSVMGPRKGPGYLLSRDAYVPPGEWREAVPAVERLDLRSCVPVGLRDHISSAAREPEHRQVTVAFLHFDETDALIVAEGIDRATKELDVLVSDVQDAADEHGVTFLGTDLDKDGGKIILLTGAPTTSGDDERRMLVALRQIMDRDRTIPIRVGVNRGHVFAGDIGPHYRRTYTVMGDAVNLAARVMAKATRGQLLAAAGVVDHCPATFETSALEPFLVKGKAKPVQAYAIGALTRSRRTDAAYDLPLTGRSEQVGTLVAALLSAREGNGRLVEISGDPGIGKSRLVDEVRNKAQGLVVLSVGCEPYQSSTPYLAFRYLLRRLLGVTADTEAETVRVQLHHALESASPTLVRWAPLLAPVLDVSIEETPESSDLEERFRRVRLAEVMHELMSEMLEAPTVMIFEDTHWMDESSAELVEHLAARVGDHPWLILVTRRDQGGGFRADPDNATILPLAPLSEQSALELLDLATKESPIDSHELAALAERSGGNPLFLRELLASAGTADKLEGLPDSVEALIAARIDSLPPTDRNMLRRASVLGRSFPPGLLWEVLGEKGLDPDQLRTRLGGYIRPLPDGRLAFDQLLIRDCAYEGLSYRMRRQLHARVGDVIRMSAADTAAEQAEMLSFHYFFAQQYEEALKFAQVAAERAKAAYANAEAVTFYERAIESARHVPDMAPTELAQTYEMLGDVNERMGRYAIAEKAYRSVRRLTRNDPVTEARMLLKLSRAQGSRDRYSNALRWITRGLGALSHVDGPEADRQKAQLKTWYGHFCLEEGRYEKAITWCQSAIEAAEAADEREALAHALVVLDWAYEDLGRLDELTNTIRAIKLLEEIGDLRGHAAALNSLGLSNYGRGDWARAIDCYHRARELARRTGNVELQASITSNLGEVSLDQGRLDEANELLTEASRAWRASGIRGRSAFATCRLARVACRRGEYEAAKQLFGEALSDQVGVGAQAESLETTARMAECLLMAGDVDSALELSAEALHRAEVLGGVVMQLPLLHRVRGVALARHGDLDSAQQSLVLSLDAAAARNADYDRALTLHMLIALGLSSKAEDDLEVQDSIVRRLDVVAFPDYLGDQVLQASTA